MKLIDLVGERFGKLTVLKRSGSDKFNKPIWLCKCDCGNEKMITGASLRNGLTISCGCFGKNARKTHGKHQTGAFKSWTAMKQRCGNPHNHRYADYGGRGIKYCDRWADFENFYEDMGDRPPDRTLDRIDVNGNYCPENCKWSTHAEQSRNQRRHQKHIGVVWLKRNKKWRAQISGKYIGTFDYERDAIEARKQAELKHWGKSSI